MAKGSPRCRATSSTGHRAHLVPLDLTLTLHSCVTHGRWLCTSEEPVLGSTPVPNLSPPGIPLQAGCLTIPLQRSWEASRLCLSQGPFLPQGKQEILLGEGTSSIQG